MLKQRKLANALVVLALGTFAVPAMAASSPFPQSEFNAMFWSPEMMRRMDTNKDGMVSRDEFMTYMGRQYDMMDTGKKKMLTAAQFTDKAMMSKTFPATAGE